MMKDSASTLTGLAVTFLSVPVVVVLLNSPVRCPSLSAGDKPRWSEKRSAPQLWRSTRQPYILMYAGLLSVITKFSTCAKRPTGNQGACLTGFPDSQVARINLWTSSYKGVAVCDDSLAQYASLHGESTKLLCCTAPKHVL